MAKIFKTILIGSLATLIFVVGNLLLANAVLAQVPPEDPKANNLIVNFTPDPLFDADNFLPGDSRTGEAEVINNTEESKRVAAEAINYPGFPVFPDVTPDIPTWDLSRALTIIIKEKNGSDLYGGSSPTGVKTLFDFYKNGETYLSDVSGNKGEKIYEFIISFPADKENDWQETTTNFDIIVGFQGEEGRGTGGSGGLPSGLIIKYEKAYDIKDTSAWIKWWTSYDATSRVIYCKKSESCVLDLSDNADNPPLYGFNNTTDEEDTPANPKGVTYHEMQLTGLDANTTYSYRAVSHASPPTISREYTFTTLEKGIELKGAEEEIESVSGSYQNIPDNNSSNVFYPKRIAQKANDFVRKFVDSFSIKDSKDEGKVKGEKDEKINVKNAEEKSTEKEVFEEKPSFKIWWWLILVLLFLIIAGIVYYYRKKIH